MKYFLFVTLLSLTALASGVSLNGYMTEKDIKSLRTVFSTATTSSSSDLAAIFYGVKGLTLLKEKITDNVKVCDAAKKLVKENDLESLYYVSGLSTMLENCKLSVSKSQELVSASIGEDKNTQDLFYAISAAKYFGLNYDATKFLTSLTAVIKKEDSASSLSYAFHAASLLPEANLDAIFNRIEDCVAQADEIDGKLLQFEGGLSVTAFAVSGIYSLAERVNKAPAIKADEAVKFANYLFNRRGASLVRPAANLLQAMQLLSTNQFQTPLAFSLASSISVSNAQPNIRVRISDILGHSVGPVTVTVDNAIHLPTKGVVINKKPINAVAGDSSLYEFNFMETKRESGFYTVTLSAVSASSKKLVGTQGAELSVKVSTEITVENVEVAVVDRDQTTMGGNVMKVPTFSKLNQVLEADTHQKVIMKFTVKDKTTNTPTKVHQAFVLFTHVKSGQEIIFIAEADASKSYKFDVDLQKSAKDFEYLNGKYSMKLILGDAVVNNAIDWHVADINLQFPEYVKPERSSVDQISYEKKPEIVHMFRQPEKRPSQFVSDLFTGLVLAPLVLLFVLWLRIGINISNFPVSLYAVGFHVGLGAIFGLYFVFWLQLNMFQTLKYLSVIACLTFLTGNRMLRGMADKRKNKSE